MLTRPPASFTFQPKRLIAHGPQLRSPIYPVHGTSGAIAYELGSCYQLDDQHVLVLASLDEQGGGDLCVGNDAYVIRQLADLSPERALPVNRVETDYKMDDGRLAFLAKFPALAGVLPLDATLPSGEPHPGAGTGFLLSPCVTFAQDKSSALANPESFLEMIQFRWDGKALTFFGHEFLQSLLDLPLNGDMSLSPFCLHDGGFLAPLGVTLQGICVFRFEWTGDQWGAIAHGEPFCSNSGQTGPTLPGEPWAYAPGEIEPSLRQTQDGFYLFTRGIDPVGRLYHSEDGFRFSKILERPNVTVPQVLNQAPDGSLYLATNSGPGWLRNPLVAYSLSGNTADVSELVIHDQDGIRDGDGEKIPFVDHAIASTVILEGKTRHLIFYRVCDLKERTLHQYQIDAGDHLALYGDGGPSERLSTTGLYAAELEF